MSLVGFFFRFLYTDPSLCEQTGISGRVSTGGPQTNSCAQIHFPILTIKFVRREKLITSMRVSCDEPLSATINTQTTYSGISVIRPSRD